jgi:hypothetical protein
VLTNGSGVATIDVVLVADTPGGQSVTATSNRLNNTSQFSNCVTMVGPTPSPSPTPSPTPSPSPTPTSSATPTPSGTAQVLGDADCDGDVDLDDAIAALSEFAGVDPGADCGDGADVDCDNDVDAMDALRIVLHVADVPMPQPSGCGAIGEPV